ncbi:hypothetical protein [Microbacterium invictum]|uniref:Uncharacterized protein n=1 Tax=Microbacterium invictum TaxID=515415 RepID=A0AA40SR50_9MICO|nr:MULTISPECIES: hypothetical protein [Microbacterium]MBB4140727.1 hypothetical protein [Microbacterium invictum]
MTTISTTSPPWIEAAHRLGVARERLRALSGEVDVLRARARALAAATDWQSRSVDRYRDAMTDLIERFDRIADGFDLADQDLDWEQQRLRSLPVDLWR